LGEKEWRRYDGKKKGSGNQREGELQAHVGECDSVSAKSNRKERGRDLEEEAEDERGEASEGSDASSSARKVERPEVSNLSQK
jgi:hypothetical protein